MKNAHKSSKKPKKTIVFKGVDHELTFSLYADKSTCIMARNLDTNTQHNVTVNIPDSMESHEYIMVKNVGDLEGIYNALLDFNIIEEAKSKVQIGNYYALVCKMIQ